MGRAGGRPQRAAASGDSDDRDPRRGAAERGSQTVNRVSAETRPSARKGTRSFPLTPFVSPVGLRVQTIGGLSTSLERLPPSSAHCRSRVRGRPFTTTSVWCPREAPPALACRPPHCHDWFRPFSPAQQALRALSPSPLGTQSRRAGTLNISGFGA